MITFPCSGCERTLKVPDHHAGKRARCPECRASTPVPAALGERETPTLPPAPSLPQGHTLARPTAIADQPKVAVHGDPASARLTAGSCASEKTARITP